MCCLYCPVLLFTSRACTLTCKMRGTPVSCFIGVHWRHKRKERMNRNGSSKDFERVSSNFCNMFLQRVSSTSFFNEHPLGTPVGQVTVKASSSLWAILNNKIWKPRTETALGQNWGKVMLMEVAHQIHWKIEELTKSDFLTFLLLWLSLTFTIYHIFHHSHWVPQGKG